MTEEQIEQKKRFAGEKIPSMQRRHEHHDYTGNGFYMVTLTTEGRRPLLGELTGRCEAAPGACDTGLQGSHQSRLSFSLSILVRCDIVAAYAGRTESIGSFVEQGL